MKREFLVELGLADEAIDKIMSENGKDIEAVKSKHADYESLKSTLAEANSTIESFKAMDIDAIKKSTDDWKQKAELAETESKKAIEKMQFDYALDNALRGSKARNTKAIIPFLDMEGLKLNNGEIIGLNEQIEKVKSENDYLFESDTKPLAQFTKPIGQPQGNPNSALRAAMGLEPLK